MRSYTLMFKGAPQVCLFDLILFFFFITIVFAYFSCYWYLLLHHWAYVWLKFQFKGHRLDHGLQNINNNVQGLVRAQPFTSSFKFL